MSDLHDRQYSKPLKNVKPGILQDGRMDRASAARYLGCKPQTLAKWAMQGRGPRCVRVVGRVFYFKHDLDAFIQAGAE